jgi:putative phage-type endonuclease
MSREEWLRLRALGLGGSDIAAVAGVSDWGGAASVYLEKTGAAPSKEESEAMQWGHYLEAEIARVFAEREGLEIRRVNAILQHPEHPFMLANLDFGIVDPVAGNGVLEVKNVGRYRAPQFDDGALPPDIECQVRWYMAVCDYNYAFVAALLGGNELAIRFVERDLDIERYLLKIGGEFWQMVQAGEMPAMDSNPRTGQMLAKMFAKSRPEAIGLPPIALDYIALWQVRSEQIKEYEAEKEIAENELKALLKESEVGLCQKFQAGWKNVTTNRLDGKALEEAEPDVYKRFLKESSYRRFGIKELKPKKERKKK